MSPSSVILRLSALDLYLCERCNSIGSRLAIGFFTGVSRLGDGAFWAGLLLVLPFAYGRASLPVVADLLGVGFVTLVFYKVVKARIARPRPYESHGRIVLLSAPLDRYSFPSGHTLHAVALTVVALSHHPELASLLVPFTLAVALSRVILGLHYPSDVLAGAALGALLASLSLLI